MVRRRVIATLVLPLITFEGAVVCHQPFGSPAENFIIISPLKLSGI
ncbi:MAG: hypothetical protein H8D82_01895 [Euryarchaeota archaeon]|nr:hypothetical protein [Euryarchaeota archaeon]